MDKENKENNNLLDYYTQTKQRVDLNIDMNNQKIIAQTKLTFILKNEKQTIKDDISEVLYLHLNAENIFINNIKILKNDFEKINKKNDEKSSSFNEKNMKTLEFKNTSPVCFYKSYLDLLFQNIEELESYKNIKRIEWEIRQKGNLIIKIPKIFYLNENNSKKINNNEKSESENCADNLLIKKIKIIINYTLIEKNIGIIFQEFFELKKDISYIICYTPNFYFNTQYWIPCIYKLDIQIKWSLYLYIPDDYISCSSCSLNKIIKNENDKKLIIYKNNTKTTARNIGFCLVNKKYFEINMNSNFMLVYNKNKTDIIQKFLIKNKLIETLYNFYSDFFDINIEKSNAPTSIVFIPYLLFNNQYQGFNKFLKLKEDNYLSFIKFPNLYILPEKYIYNENIPDISKFQLKILSKLFISNYIGGLIIEKTYADFWIISGLENWVNNKFLNKFFNDNNHIKIKIYKWLLKLKKECENGKEKFPIYSNNFSNPIEIQLNPIFYLKAKIIFHTLEQRVGQQNIKNILKEIINEREIKGYNISTEILIDKIKKYENNINNFFELFIYRTGIPEINLSYNYDSVNNLFEYELQIESVTKKYYAKNPFFTICNIDYDYLKKIGKELIVIDYRAKANKVYNIDMNIEIVYRNGIEIKKEIFELNSEIMHGKYILSNEPKKLISEITQIEKDFFYSLIENTGIDQVYKNEEIEEILSQNLILWVSIDSKLSFLWINEIKPQHILNK